MNILFRNIPSYYESKNNNLPPVAGGRFIGVINKDYIHLHG
jgi:hypothetical protein